MIDWLLKRSAYLKQLETELKNNSLKIATLEGAYLIKSQSQKSQSQGSLKIVSGTIETKLIQRIRKNKKSIIIAEIMKLLPSYSIIDTFDRIVLERKLCSKASFYRYIQSLKSQNLINTETTETKPQSINNLNTL
jgi:hypothetical protein